MYDHVLYVYVKTLATWSSNHGANLTIIDTKTFKTLFYTEASQWNIHQSHPIGPLSNEITVQIQSKLFVGIDAELYIFHRPGKWY